MSDNPGNDVSDNSHDLFAVRLAKLEEMRAQGEDPFSANWDQKHTSVEAKALFQEGEEAGPEISVAGRIIVFRLMGKASFVKIQDRAGQIQLYVKRDEVGEDVYQAFKKWDLGDIVGAKGTLFTTKTGEVTVRVQSLGLVSKSLRPLPEKWHGLTDSEQVYRQRYLDLIVNAESRERFNKRSQIIREIRKFLWSRDFTEVETPCFQSIAGGAAARPFTTHMNALDCDFYLRISLELYLKRMLVAGCDRVFELGRIFRNEGLSRRHNPEFTMLEVYQAYTDYRGMMELMYSMVQHLCKEVIGSTQVTRPDGEVIELGGTWREARYKDLILEVTEDADWFSRSKEEKLKRCAAMGIEVDPSLEDFAITNDVFEKKIEPGLIQPTFVTHIPRELCPLAKINKDDASVLDVFELCINGQEIAPAYSEQNDPFVQREMFESQVGEDIQNLDQDFLAALEHGMPPAGGMGVGIDRLCILLTGASNIRDTILFPTLRPV
ncbi:MAG TPA: lysine--tRNA ligase [Opitutae bacterium]|nr:lysine--tRNA ligase [Opitutae bacterium]|tara:strand:- start:231 stop:1706 length:1476 start_codon:yes stop_codon:yes gene_type:complete